MAQQSLTWDLEEVSVVCKGPVPVAEDSPPQGPVLGSGLQPWLTWAEGFWMQVVLATQCLCDTPASRLPGATCDVSER